jgi:hypothetical protein
MSKKTDQFEHDLVSSVQNSLSLPNNLPDWLISLGVQPGDEIIEVKRVGSSGSKTDVLIRLQNSPSIKISAKLSSADYFGNWYSHNRVIEEFGEEAFERLVQDCTIWANQWKSNPSASLFAGVSICFGKRSGDTAREFEDVFSYDDIVKIVAGYGEDDLNANCLYVSSKIPTDISDLIRNLKPIDEKVIEELSKNFKVAYRPINPMKEGTNRGKCIYTQFRPFKRLSSKTIVTDLSHLSKLGEFVQVEANSLNHNRLLNILERDYNIYIPRK